MVCRMPQDVRTGTACGRTDSIPRQNLPAIAKICLCGGGGIRTRERSRPCLLGKRLNHSATPPKLKFPTTHISVTVCWANGVVLSVILGASVPSLLITSSGWPPHLASPRPAVSPPVFLHELFGLPTGRAAHGFGGGGAASHDGPGCGAAARRVSRPAYNRRMVRTGRMTRRTSCPPPAPFRTSRTAVSNQHIPAESQARILHRLPGSWIYPPSGSFGY